MPRFTKNLFLVDAAEPRPHPFGDGEPLLFAGTTMDEPAILAVLTHKVGKKPRDLFAHVRRIYFCYQQALSEPLYAALLDLLIILDGKGRQFSQRLLQGSRSRLDAVQWSLCKQALDSPANVAGNRHSLFTTGTIGTLHLVEIRRKQQEQHDYLALANDYIEYSQLEEAMAVLERGLDEQPGRQDFQAALLELYRSTLSSERFRTRYEAMQSSGLPLIEDWRAVADFFAGMTS